MSRRGGKRIGAGRKRKHPLIKALPNGARVLQHPSTPAPLIPSEIKEIKPPDTLTAEERVIWDRQAPHALANGTLTPATAMAFEHYCQVVVLERNEAKSSVVSGANHRGLIKQVSVFEQQFLLAPTGRAMLVLPTGARPLSSPEPTEDSDAEFFG